MLQRLNRFAGREMTFPARAAILEIIIIIKSLFRKGVNFNTTSRGKLKRQLAFIFLEKYSVIC